MSGIKNVLKALSCFKQRPIVVEPTSVKCKVNIPEPIESHLHTYSRNVQSIDISNLEFEMLFNFIDTKHYLFDVVFIDRLATIKRNINTYVLDLSLFNENQIHYFIDKIKWFTSKNNPHYELIEDVLCVYDDLLLKLRKSIGLK